MKTRFTLIILTLAILVLLPCCSKESNIGSIIGIVQREGNGIIPNPVLIIIPGPKDRVDTPLTVYGDDKGRFSSSMLFGNYSVKVGARKTGPFFEWPKSIRVIPNRTTVVLFTIPKDFEL